MNLTHAPYFAAPRYRRQCAIAAHYLLREREARFPATIAAGRVTEEAATASLDLARALVEQWRWVTDPAAPPLPEFSERGHFGVYNFMLAAEMTGVASRARSLAERIQSDAKASELADLCEALSWLQTDDGGLARVVMAVQVERAMARAKTPILEQARAA